MSASEIIQQIKALPLDEQQEVKAYLNEGPRSLVVDAAKLDADRNARVRGAADHVFTEYKELLGKLAQ